MQMLADWLKTIGLERYAPVFAANEIDFDALPLLSDADLQGLGLALGPRRTLLKAIAERQAPAAAPAGVPDQPTPTATPAPAEADGERRQITVLFCDMVGFTELASRVDPEVLQRIIQAYEDACAVCITRYAGYVFQRLGDGIVAFFGYPLAHEGEAERAVHAGLAIIDALAKLELPEVGQVRVRIGIAAGLVVVSTREKGAVGATMNLAARLQGIAPVGHIVVSESVRQLAGGQFVYDALGPQVLKGFDSPVEAYDVRGLSAVASRFDAATRQGLTPIVGREQEVAALMERWNQAQDGEGQVVLVAGEPGVGKSRVLGALRERLEAQGARILRYQCSPYHANSAFFPIVDQLSRSLDFARDEPVDARLAKLEAMVVGRLGRPIEDLRILAALLAIPADAGPGPSTLTPQRLKDETLRALTDLAKAIAREGPAVMLFEDTQWIDPTSLAWLELLVGQSSGLPLLIVLTHRPEFVVGWSAYGHVSALNLSKLSRPQCALLVSRLTQGRALPAGLLDGILARTDGVPLFVEELTKSILESDELRQAGDNYVYRRASQSIDIPATLRDSLMARLDHYAEAKEIAQIGAVIGREFSLELIEAVLPRPRDELERALRRLIDAGLVFKRGLAPAQVYRFKHALVQDVAYDSLLKRRRQELHAAIATAIEAQSPSIRETQPEVLAQHFSSAGHHAAAVALWQAAATLAAQRMALLEAIWHLNGAVKDAVALPASPERDRIELGLHASLGTLYMLAKGWAAPEVEKAYARANELSASLTDPDDAVWTLWGICVFHLVRGEIGHAREIGVRIDALAAAANSRRAHLVAHMLGVQLALYAGDFAGAQRHWDAAEPLYVEGEDLELIPHFSTDLRLTLRLHGAHLLWLTGHADRAAAMCTQQRQIARALDHAYSLSWSLTWGAIPLLYLGEHEALLASVDEGIRIAEEHGIAYTAAIGRVARGWAWARSGARGDGIHEMRAGLLAFRATGAGIVVPFFQTLLAEALCGAGEFDEAGDLLDAALEQIERWGERWQEAEVHRVQGLRWAQGPNADPARAAVCFTRAIELASAQRAVAWEERARAALAGLAVAQR